MFKLINFLEFAGFNQLRHRMGAPLAKKFAPDIVMAFLDQEALKRLGHEGIDVELKDISIEKDKTLSYKGQRVLVYIRDVGNYKNTISLPKYHVSYCNKLEEMRQVGRWTRYVVSNREDGYFQINLINNSIYKRTEKLDVCQFCLETLHWQNFSMRDGKLQRSKIVSSFSIAVFYQKYSKSLFSIKPKYTSDIAPLNDYTRAWNSTSKDYRKSRNFQCDNARCGLILKGKYSRFLHVHHIDGNKANNKLNNLKALCIRCHSEEPHHSHMKELKDYKEFISILPYDKK